METRPVQARGGCVSHRRFADGARLRAWKGACCLEGTPPTELTEQTVVLLSLTPISQQSLSILQKCLSGSHVYVLMWREPHVFSE